MSRSHTRRALAGALSLYVVTTLLVTRPAGAIPPEPPPGRSNSVHCNDGQDLAFDLTLQVDGETATGRYALPTSPPEGLVVFAHGYGHTSASWVEHMKTAAREHDVIAVAMDYRGIEISPDSNGDGLPESRGWNVMKGAEDSIAAAQLFESGCPTIDKISIFGVSMGGNTSGLAVALAGERGATTSEGEPLFDYWFDIEGAVNMIETYVGATLVAPTGNATAVNAKEDIEAETGGTPLEEPDAYRERAVVTRVDDIKRAGIEGVVMVHGLDDGLVPYNQAREMSSLLLGAAVPTDLFSIGRRSKESEQETTLTGYVGSQLDKSYKSPLAGHASEKSTTHIVMVTAFERLWATMDDDVAPGPYREFFVDGEQGTFPPP